MNINLDSAFIIFAIGHLAVTIWWASKVNTILALLISEVREMKSEMKSMHSIIFTKNDASRELAIAEREHSILHKRIDELDGRLAH